MADLKLTVDQIKNYLGTGLKIDRVWIHAYGGFDGEELDLSVLYHCRISEIKPHCHRLSDLDKFIPELGFVPLKKLYSFLLEDVGLPDYDADFILCRIDDGRMPILNAPFYVVQKLFQWHFWPFGDEYFDAGLVIDKMKEVGNE